MDLTSDEGAYLLYPVEGGKIISGPDNSWTIGKHSSTPIISETKIIFKDCIKEIPEAEYTTPEPEGTATLEPEEPITPEP